MEISDEGLPIHQDATMSLRPRLFLEGNLFVDLRPGTPAAPDAPDGFVFGSPDEHLAGVQCETCHGPGAAHVASPRATNILREVPERVCLGLERLITCGDAEAHARERHGPSLLVDAMGLDRELP